MATRHGDGNMSRATPNTVTAMRLSAENRRCPKCGRKSALVRTGRDFPGEITTVCRWADCDYARRSWTEAEWAVIRQGDPAGNELLASGVNILSDPAKRAQGGES